ncbi:MAG: SEC10/PgrA surface exclusion domain-containing protein [Lactobacillus sp.]|nr:SEC10/PgrA surface exclusion domain-containing protein [Lactobacillus sp.]
MRKNRMLGVAVLALALATGMTVNTVKADTNSTITTQSQENNANQNITPVDAAADANKITLSSDYINAVKNFANGNGSASDVENKAQGLFNQYTTEDNSSQGKRPRKVIYHDVDADKQEVVNDYKHLTDGQAKELSNFTASIINNLRSQFGSKQVYVTDDSVKLAKDDVDQAYVSKNWNVWEVNAAGDGIDNKSHNSAELRNFQKSKQLMGYSENISMGPNVFLYTTNGQTGKRTAQIYSTAQGTVTMNDLKKWAFDGIIRMLFDDSASNWGHATNFLVDMDSSVKNTPVKYREVWGVASDQNGFFHYLGYGVPDKDTIPEDEVYLGVDGVSLVDYPTYGVSFKTRTKAQTQAAATTTQAAAPKATVAKKTTAKKVVKKTAKKTTKKSKKSTKKAKKSKKHAKKAKKSKK